jgi:hypothetical protein
MFCSQPPREVALQGVNAPPTPPRGFMVIGVLNLFFTQKEEPVNLKRISVSHPSKTLPMAHWPVVWQCVAVYTCVGERGSVDYHQCSGCFARSLSWTVGRMRFSLVCW